MLHGYYVIHPMGWDAFGLPAENYAIKMGVHPKKSTAQNVANIKRQIQEIAAVFKHDIQLARRGGREIPNIAGVHPFLQRFIVNPDFCRKSVQLLLGDDLLDGTFPIVTGGEGRRLNGAENF